MKISKVISVVSILAAATIAFGFLLGKLTPEQARDYGGTLFFAILLAWWLGPKEE